MRAFIIAAGLLFAMAPAYAQGLNFGTPPKDPALDPARQKERDEAYRSSLQRIPAKEAPIDPWGSTRGATPAEAAASPPSRPKKQ